MLKLRSQTTIIILLSFSLSSLSFSETMLNYNPSDLEQFISTNQCNSCDLSGAGLYGNHSQASLIKANLSNVNANSINLSQADITNADMTQSSFTYANLSHANFTGAITIKAQFDNANLYGATITLEQLAKAQSICNAILPDGSIGKCP